MEIANQIIRLNYVRISQCLEAEMIFLSELAELTDDERFKQSVAEVIYQFGNLSDSINLQRRYLSDRT